MEKNTYESWVVFLEGKPFYVLIHVRRLWVAILFLPGDVR